ncbi:MAG: hypothetical protein LBE59_02990 [Nevskiaceae bacterium]|jgi:hypothetical protein|nr:hypothetical protein [Nevskiaceae bacterium]
MNILRKFATFGLLSALALGGLAQAHHSYAATFDLNQRIELDGKVVQFGFRNPHSFLQVEVPDGKGGVARWSVEWSGAASLSSAGIERGTLRPGDAVKITASPSRVKGELRAQILTIRRESDGFTWGLREGEVVD